MKAYEIAKLLEKEFPPAIAEEWDNVGILIGREEKEVKKALLTLDVTDSVVDEAIECGADMIIAHHPMLFAPIKRISDKTPEGRRIIRLIQNDITVFAAHTNLDSAKMGINSKLAEMFGLRDSKPVFDAGEGMGLGRIGTLDSEMSAEEFAKLAKQLLNTTVRISGDCNKKVECVAVGSGACDDIIPEALKMGADIILTGDCKYHRNLDFVAMGAVVVDAGHYPTEIIATDIFEEVLKNTGIEIVKSNMKDIFKFI